MSSTRNSFHRTLVSEYLLYWTQISSIKKKFENNAELLKHRRKTSEYLMTYVWWSKEETGTGCATRAASNRISVRSCGTGQKKSTEILKEDMKKNEPIASKHAEKSHVPKCDVTISDKRNWFVIEIYRRLQIEHQKDKECQKHDLKGMSIGKQSLPGHKSMHPLCISQESVN